MITLRPYQDAGVNNIRASYIAKKKAPLYVLPTGGGKTVVFTYMAMSSAKRNKKALILVHRVELLKQTSAALRKFGVEHGLINRQFTPNLSAGVQVASVQTLVKRMSKYDYKPDVIIIDEAHHATAGTWKKIIANYPNALLLGVTATPERGDGSGLGTEEGGAFDDIIIGPQIYELIEMGFLTKPIVYAPAKKLDLKDIEIKRGDYDKKELSKRIDKPEITGDTVREWERICEGTPTIVFCIDVKHAEDVARAFQAAGYRFYSVDGTMSDEQRERLINGLSDLSVQGITSCDLISEGTDIPAVGCGIFLRPTQSLGLFVQQAGRPLRPVYAPGFDLSTIEGRFAAMKASGKTAAIILDQVGNCLRHGLPQDHREWSLKGSKKRKRNGDIGPTIHVKQCPKCYVVQEPGPMCLTPGCGFVYEVKKSTIQVVDGELKPITDTHALAIQQARKREVGMAQSIEDLQRIAAERGYKSGWVDKMAELKKIIKKENI